MGDSRADVGILFVHGIGQQVRAETLLNFAEPLVTWVDASSRASGGTGARVLEAELADDEQPARTTVHVGLQDGMSTQWLLAESNWAASFPVPEASAVLMWAGRFSGRALQRIVAHLLRPVRAAAATSQRVFGYVRSAGDQQVEAAEDPISAASGLTLAILIVGAVILALTYLWVPMVLYAVTLLLFGLLAFVGTFAFAIALAVGIHVPLVKKRLSPLAARLVTSVGDSYALVHQPIRHAAMDSKISTDLDWLSRNAREVVVVAHSQGAALATRLLLADTNPPVHTLVTVGAAVSLLHDQADAPPVATWRATRPDMRWVNIWAGWDPVSAGPIVDPGKSSGRKWDLVYGEPLVGPEPVPATARRPFAIFGHGALTDPPAPRDPSRPRGPVAEMLAAAGAGLTQVYKEMGHVALGAIPKPGEVKRDKPPPGPEEVAVHNRASILRDHNSYHANDVQVLARIASAAADAAGHGALWDGEPRRELLAAAERRHVTAVRLLGAARIVNALAALLVAGWLAAEGIAATGFAWAGRVAGSFNTDFKSWFERVPGASVGDAVRLALLAALLFAVWHGLTSSAWASWRRGELQRATGQSNRRWSPAAIPFAALLALSVAASALALERLLHRSNDPDHLKAGLIVAGIELLMVGWSWFGFRPRSVPAGPFGDDEGAPAGGDEPARAAPAQV